MPFDGPGNYVPDEEPPMPSERMILPNARAMEIIEMKERLYRCEQCLRHVRPFVTSPSAQERIDRVLGEED